MSLSMDPFVPKTDCERNQAERFKAEGKAEALLEILADRSIAVSETERQRILAERDLAVLRRWLSRALSAHTAADLL